MNDNDVILDATEPRRESEPSEPAGDELRREETGLKGIEQEPVTEGQTKADHEESAPLSAGVDASDSDVSADDSDVVSTTAEEDPNALTSAEAGGGADAASDEREDRAPHEEGGEPQQRRVILEAGTDEESLKALALCREKVTQLHLRMHPLAARWESDRHVIIFFRADDKVDFRKLVRELSRLLHARIELRQVGPREQGKLCGLVGKCGYPLCCQTFLSQFAQSTIKMAKTQELALNPMKISGVCGRLLCCLNYEQQMYLEARANMPRVNKMVDTEFGPGRVVAVNVLKQTVTVQLEAATRELHLDQVHPPDPQA
jgi:cell fate regulator YaaT (PSP1 superfamily)